MSESDSGKRKVFVVIPAFNEENSVGKVIEDLPKEIIEEIIVVNNNSNDKTSHVASQAGATVLDEKIPGYGRACLKGIDYVERKGRDQDIIVFIDADYSDFPEELPKLIEPIDNNGMELVIGSRKLGEKEEGSMTIPQEYGNKFACFLMRLIYGARFTDLGPFRSIRLGVLKSLNMKDLTYGWTVEMQVKAVKSRLNYAEVPVNYRKRIGFSKISGTLEGTIKAGYKIITTILKS